MTPSQELPAGAVTFVFTDIEGSTRMVQALGDDWVAVLERHHRLVGDAIESQSGTVVKTEGDAFFAVFTSPLSAALAAIEVQRSLAAAPWPEGGVVRVRIGIHTGIGVLGAGDYVGLDVHRAARISDAAHGGQVVMSEATAVLVERDLPEDARLRDLGKFRLKDLSEPETIFQLIAAGLATEFGPLRTLDVVPNNLPRQLTSFVGRQAEVEEATRLLEASRLLTFTGPGGTGKTRLALQVAAEMADTFRDGVFFVELASTSDPSVVASHILDSLGLSASARDQTPEARLLEQISDRQLLLILDNFEQLLESAPLVAAMVRSAPMTKFLVTSRAPLKISGEQEMPIPPLGMREKAGGSSVEASLGSEAVQLFTERALAVRPDFIVDEHNAAAVAELVRRLDGLPLAIELVASRLRVLSVSQILGRLDARMLEGGSIDLPERQRTIQNAIDWSYELLEPPGQKLFARFSVFSGGGRLEEVERIAGPTEELGADLLDCLGVLVDHSLIRRVDDDGHPRFRMLHVIREFALQCLERSGEADLMHERHATAYTGYVETVAPELLKRDRKEWLDLLEHDHDNLRSALDWAVDTGHADIGFRLAAATWRFWQARGHLHEARRRVDDVLTLPGGEPRHRAKAMEALGGILWWQAEMGRCYDVYQETLALQRQLGDKKEIANACYNFALVTAFGHGAMDAESEVYAQAWALLDEAENLYGELGDESGLGDVEWGRGNTIAYAGGSFEPAVEHMKRSIEHYRRSGNEFGMGWGMFEVGDMERRLGRLEESWGFVHDGLELFAGHKDVSGVVMFIAVAAGLAKDLGDAMRAYRLAGAFHGLRITSGVDIVRFDTNQIEGLEFETLEAITGEPAEAYRRGREMAIEEAVEYALDGPIDHPEGEGAASTRS